MCLPQDVTKLIGLQYLLVQRGWEPRAAWLYAERRQRQLRRRGPFSTQQHVTTA